VPQVGLVALGGSRWWRRMAGSNSAGLFFGGRLTTGRGAFHVGDGQQDPRHAPTGPWSGQNGTKRASGHKGGRSKSERRGPSLEIQSVRRQLGQPAEASRSVTPTFSAMCSGSTAAPTI
jgi:hypothetical protein